MACWHPRSYGRHHAHRQATRAKNHGRDFLRGSLGDGHDVDHTNEDASTPWLDRIWLIIMLPGLVLAALVALQVDVDALFASDYLDKPASLLGVLGGVLAVTIW